MLNWAQLKDKNRVKDIGIAWTNEEQAALALGIPADSVRSGILTLEAFEKAEAKDAKEAAKTGEVKIEKLKLAELKVKATALGVEFTPEATREALIKSINAKLTENAAAAKAKEEADQELENNEQH